MPTKVSKMPATGPAAKGAPAKRGKRKSPVFYSPEIAEQIVTRLAAGERWHNIAGTRGLPTHTAPYKWAQKDPKFRAEFILARQVGADGRADKVLDIAETATNETLNVDKFHVGSLKWHVDRETKLYGAKPDEPDLGANRKIIIEVRQFERAVRDDGTAFVREILPSGEVIDLD